MVLLVALLAGCTFPSTPAPSTPTDQDSSAPCARLSLVAAPDVASVQARSLVTLTLVNCGQVPLPVFGEARCGGDQALAVTFDGPSGVFEWTNASPGGFPSDIGRVMVSHGPCPTEAPPTLAPGANLTQIFPWNAAFAKARLDEENTSFGRAITAYARPTRAAAGTYQLEARYRAGANRTLVADAVVDVEDEGVVAAPPGYSGWRAAPPPPLPLARPTTSAFFVAPDAGRELALMAANDSLRDRLLMGNISLVTIDHLSMDAFCSGEESVCDRWGWQDMFLVRYKIELPGAPGLLDVGPFPVTPNGWVIEDDITGVPDCYAAPAECVINVTSADAERIAHEHGFANGTRPWNVTFAWERQNGSTPAGAVVWSGTYAWEVRNTLDSDGYGGDMLIIDANDGVVLGESHWSSGVNPAASP